MPKGKSFTAAEKHFYKRKQQYEEQIKQLNSKLRDTQTQLQEWKNMADLYQNENERLKQWIDRLLEYTELSKEDIKAACDKDIAVNEALSLMTVFTKGLI